ncbi:MAG: cation-translocating P-type ATPase [Deltaproteobacteria bacterium]|nr:cation-translocating P-type ATPase [Deltaproteobacteria bacterium]
MKTHAEDGLAETEAKKRLSYFGSNVLPSGKKLTLLHLTLKQLKDFMILILILVAAISYVTHDLKDAVVILAVVIINTILGVIQEYKAEKTIESLKMTASAKAKIIRDGKIKIIPASQIVPGDVLIIEEGDVIQADGRILELVNLSTQESFLTGESLPIEKTKEALKYKQLAIADRKNCVFRGASVASGHGKVVVTATGAETELGKIAHLITEIKDKPTPLEIKLKVLGKNLVLLTITLCLLVATIGILRGIPTLMMLKIAIVLGVACIPEGLIAVVAIALALGVQRMAKKNAIIRRLPAVEALGAVTTICSDKTGTLTEGQMMAQAIFVNQQEISVTGNATDPQGKLFIGTEPLEPLSDELQKFFAVCTLCNNATLQAKGNTWEAFGDPTETALLVLGAKAGFSQEKLEERFGQISEAPFDSKRKCMSKLFEDRNTKSFVLLTKGAPEKILKLCSHEQHGGQLLPITEEIKKQLADKIEKLAAKGFRILALAYRALDPTMRAVSPLQLEKNLNFLGLVAIADPIRQEARHSIRICHEAGIRTLLITGDHPQTAAHIGAQLGMISAANQVLNGTQLDTMTPLEFDRALLHHSVLARISPHLKLKIIESLKRQGQIVAMTGDGVNDAPAIKRANVGIAMGKTGTDVAKQAADIVLADDNFSTIVAAIEEGRTIYNNIVKFIRYLLSCNMGEILIMFFATLFALPLPLIPIQILWMNLVTDTPPALALGVDPASQDMMKQSPRHPKEAIFSKPLICDILLNGLLMSAIVLGLFWVELRDPVTTIEKARTIAFSSLVMVQLFHAFNCQNKVLSLFKTGILSNPALIIAVLVSISLLLLGMYVPWLQRMFELTSLQPWDWIQLTVASMLILVFVEIQKFWMRRRNKATDLDQKVN